MSGKFPRTYSRKRPPPGPPISQFDALVKEGSNVASNQPSATKTAGHVGKWGKTSYTSLRAINCSTGMQHLGNLSYEPNSSEIAHNFIMLFVYTKFCINNYTVQQTNVINCDIIYFINNMHLLLEIFLTFFSFTS